MHRKMPERLAFYEVMMRRSVQPAEYEKLYRNAKVGFDGELRLDREWKDIGASGMLFHDFTCFNNAGHFHQIDTIYVCSHFVLVIESKNIAGKIEFNQNTRQLIRYYKNGEYEAFNDPVDQVSRHRQLIENHFLTMQHFIPVEAAVIFTHPKCIIGNIHDEVGTFVVTGLRAKLNELTKQYQHINLNMKAIRASLEKLYRPVTYRRPAETDSIRTGVFCLKCNGKMRVTTHGFKCLGCNTLDSENLALRRTLYDYRMLYGPEITNRKFRAFAEVGSRDTAYSILSRVLPDRKGINRHTTYIIPENIY